MSFGTFDPPAIIAPAPIQKAVQQQHLEFCDKLRHQMFYGTISQRGKDGRTYNYIDSNGEYVSSFLSPYNAQLLDNVEPLIRPLIAVLINKGYLTAGSCQGHPEDYKFDRWVTVAFISQEERKKFIDTVDGFGLPVYWYFNFLNFKESPKSPETRDGYTMSVNILDVIPGTVDAQQKLKYSRKDLTEYWNIMFSRNYSEYHAVKMCICSCPGDISFYTKIKIGLQWPFRNYYTNKLVLKLQTLEKYEW
jgi:hypothetical protein